MNKSILTVLAAATAVVAAGTSFAPTAAEAGGIRLGFGVPLGAFVAHSIAEDSYRRERAYERRQHKSYKAARAEREARAQESARVRAARRADKVRAAELARAEARADAAKAEARRELAKLNKAKETSVQETASIEKPVAAPVAAPVTETIAAVNPTEEVKAVEETTVATTTDSDTTKVEEAKEEPKAKTSSNKECKKFIPAVGVTISVGC